jgi:hypothetical protein
VNGRGGRRVESRPRWRANGRGRHSAAGTGSGLLCSKNRGGGKKGLGVVGEKKGLMAGTRVGSGRVG